MSPIPDDTIIPQREYVYLRRLGAKGASSYLKFATLPNIFAAQGDQRWWHDHRTPGGIMITSNPIGHFTYVKHPAAMTLEAPQTTWALEHAMRTINAAYKPPKARARWYQHCPATHLRPRAEEEATPIKPQSDLHAFSPGAYGGTSIRITSSRACSSTRRAIKRRSRRTTISPYAISGMEAQIRRTTPNWSPGVPRAPTT